MRTLMSILFSVGCILVLHGQQPLKTINNAPYTPPQPIHIPQPLQGGMSNARNTAGFIQNQMASIRPMHESVTRFQILPSGSFWIELDRNDLWQLRQSINEVVEKIIPTQTQKQPWALEWSVVNESRDEQNDSHIRIRQTLAGHLVKGQDMILHIRDGRLRDMNGFAWTAGLPKQLPDPKPSAEAMEAARQHLMARNVKFLAQSDFPGLHATSDRADLIWIPRNGKLELAYEINLHPNALDHWTVFVHASTLEIMESISQKCAFAPMQLFKKPETTPMLLMENDPAALNGATTACMDGATLTNDQDLLNQTRAVNGYQVGTTFFMIDASRTSMFQPTQSVLPNEPVGVIWTVDAQNTSPSQSNFQIVHVANTNNNWKNLEVSAHYNAGQAFEYFRQTFNRNSINGSGGNIVSIINVTDENDNDMDNAFWNGSAMFYGNGDVSFKELARGLDVAGHEMSHGVIQNTANLEYIGQSGALNESYADVFGSMIDRDDWKMGEDVVNLSVFPTGALRDLSNPNNGGSQLGDRGWQPKDMGEYVNLPNTPEGDNGGVHINSGIPNRAFFLLASSVGKVKAEQIYYKALRDYLVKSSQFIDMRQAVEKAAIDLHGSNSAELDAVRHAFNVVGIGGGQGNDYEDDIETNNGDDFILATDGSESDLYWIPPSNPSQFVKMNVPAPISRPSFTDDGVSCVYVAEDHNMILINFDWSLGLDFEAFFLEGNPQPIWRNVVASKDGTKIAYTTASLTNEIHVYDFNTDNNETFVLYNPTTANGGISTGDILYPDAMEWDYSGEYVMYDALNRIESNFGDGIEYWDISFLRAWDKGGNDFGSGQIGKLFSALPENISIGNPSFAKNSPYIITFDFLESYFDGFGSLQTDYWVIAANIESGTVNNIFQNTTVGYPSYSRLDDKILFTYDDNGSVLLGTINVQPNDKTLPVTNSDVVLITGAQKGVWFTVGNRDFSATKDMTSVPEIKIWPQPATDQIRILEEGMSPDTEYKLMNLTGTKVQAGTLGQANVIDVSTLIPGAYVLQVGRNTGRLMTARVIKQ